LHPNVFLKTFWRLELRPQIFVAMSFSPQYQQRFDEVIAPAISAVRVHSVPLRPCRVDISKSGDSILTDIMDGIAHSQMVLADVSTVGKDSVTGHAYRNGNVMYEVGLALACRQSQEVLLIRDDESKFLFDVSTVPHMKLDFTNTDDARTKLHAEILARLNARNFVNDARVQLAISTLSSEEVSTLKHLATLSPGTVWGREDKGVVDFLGMAAIPRLLDKQLIKVVGQFDKGHPAYHPTPLGLVVIKLVESGLPSFTPDAPQDDADIQEEQDKTDEDG